jgi:hypothetical protein
LEQGRACAALSKVQRTNVLRNDLGSVPSSSAPTSNDNAAVFLCRQACGHPLVDGNQRAAWAALVKFIDLDHGTWDPDPAGTLSSEEVAWPVQTSPSCWTGSMV